MALAYVLGAIIFVVVLSSIAIVLLFRIYYSGNTSDVRTAPVVRARATVLGKRASEITRGNSAHGTITTRYYYTTFNLGNDDTMELLTNKHFFRESNIGKCGTLIYKGSKFVNFIYD